MMNRTSSIASAAALALCFSFASCSTESSSEPQPANTNRPAMNPADMVAVSLKLPGMT